MNRLTTIILTAILSIAGTLLFLGDEPALRGDPTPADCGFEDMLAYELQADAYDFAEGSVICIHIDQALDSPTP